MQFYLIQYGKILVSDKISKSLSHLIMHYELAIVRRRKYIN
jgi:hypothetical protein